MTGKGLIRKEISAGRFKAAVGLLILGITAATIPILHSVTVRLMENAPAVPQFARDQVELLKDHRYWIWSQWFGKNLIQMGSIIAVVFGAGIISSEMSRRTIYFLLSQPVPRKTVFVIKYWVNLGYLLLTVSLATTVLFLAVTAGGKSYSAAEMAQQMIMAAAGLTVVFSMAALCSTFFDRPLKSAVVAAAAALLLAVPGFFPPLAEYSVYYQMAGLAIFAGKGFPFAGLAALAVVSGLLYILGRNRVMKKDF